MTIPNAPKKSRTDLQATPTDKDVERELVAAVGRGAAQSPSAPLLLDERVLAAFSYNTPLIV